MSSSEITIAPKKTRSSVPRKKTGCQTCRKRRIKCDESRPACMRCVRSGWKCDGFRTDLVSTTLPKNQNTSGVSTMAITSYSIPFKVPGSQKDRRLLHYFCVQGSSDISGFLPSGFWSQTVLRAGHQDAVVRRALVAMSSLHLDYATSNSEGESAACAETLTLYGQALSSLRKRLAKPSSGTTEIALICCILFYCCENTLGDRNAAMQHLSNGLKLLASARDGHTGDESDEIKGLTTMFERLDMQASFFEDDRIPILVLPEWKSEKPKLGSLGLEQPFDGLQDAQQRLVKLQAWLYRFVNTNVHVHNEPEESLGAEILQEKDALVQEYDSWLECSNVFELSKKRDENTLYGLRILLIQFHVCRMVLESKFPRNSEVFETSPNTSAHQTLDLAESLLQYTARLNASYNATKTPRRNFSLETGFVAPIFALALKCSDDSVAIRAAQILGSSQRREGLYDAQTMANIIAELRKSRDSAVTIKKESDSGTEDQRALEHHIPHSYNGGGVDKLLWSMSL